MLHYTKSPAGDIVVAVTKCGNLVPDAFPIKLGCGPFTSNTVAFLADPIPSNHIFVYQLPPDIKISMIGMRLKDGKEWFDGVYMRFFMLVNTIRLFFRNNLAGLYDIEIPHENSVVHTNIAGACKDDYGNTGFLHPMMDESVPTSTIDTAYFDVACEVSDDVLVDLGLTYLKSLGLQKITSVVGLHDEHIIALMEAGSFDEAYIDTYYFPNLGCEGCLGFVVLSVQQGWWGTYHATYTGYYLTVRANVDALPHYASEGLSTIPISDLISSLVHVEYSHPFGGDLYTDYDYEPGHDETREIILSTVTLPFGVETPNSVDHDAGMFIAKLGYLEPNGTPSENFLDAVGYRPSSTAYYRRGPARIETFSNFDVQCMRMLPHLIGGTYLSAVDAVNNFLHSVETNYIESTLELTEILSPLDVVRAFSTLARSGFSGIKGTGLLALLKLLANANLAYKFGVVPTLGDARILAEKVPRIIEQYFGMIFVPNTVHGSVKIPLDDNVIPGFSNCVATVRSKVRLRVNPDSSLSSVLHLEQLGLLPSMSRLWDLIPYSWLVDYFADLGTILDLADKQALLLCLDVAYSTNSISISRSLEPDGEAYNFRVDSEVGAQYKFFARNVLPGALPILGPTSLPMFRSFDPSLLLKRWDILGSVIVQKL